MKILHIGDLHLGVKKDDEWIQNIQRESFKDMVAYSKSNNINVWIQYGDVFDVRAHTTQKCMEFTRELFDLVESAGITVHTILGNHDLYYKSTLYPNTTQELLSHRNNIKIYDKPTTVDFDGMLIDLIPWMCDENTSEILEHIKNTNAEMCIGHWELNGFYFYRGMKSHGLEPDFLKKYKKVKSGHFHTISSAANVQYIGTPFTITAGDENDPRGFWVQDTKTGSFELIENPVTWHKKIFYPAPPKFDVNNYKGLAVRVIAEKIDDGLTKFEAELEKVVHTLKVISKVDNGVDLEDSDEEIDVKNMLSLMEDYIDAIGDITEDDSKALKILAKQLYIEAGNQ